MDRNYAETISSGAAAGISFHETTVSAFIRRGAEVDLHLDDVLINGVRDRVKLSVSSVSSILVDGAPNDAELMAAPDGEILALELSKHCLAFVVEWNCFSASISFTRSYKIEGEDVLIVKIGD